jgi:hypothetical protein
LNPLSLRPVIILRRNFTAIESEIDVVLRDNAANSLHVAAIRIDELRTGYLNPEHPKDQ